MDGWQIDIILLLPISFFFLLFLSSVLDDGLEIGDYQKYFGNEIFGTGYPIIPIWISQNLDKTVLLVFFHAIFLWLPYFLVCFITKSRLHGAIYLYATSIPLILFKGGFLAQGIIHLLILISIAQPFFLPFATIIGFFTHREYIAVPILTVVGMFLIMKRRCYD